MSSTDVLLNVATAARLFHASDGTGFADLIIDGHRETWPLRSKRFGAWLRQQYYERTWDAPSPAALNAALNVLEAQAQFDGPQRKVSVRLAEQDGLIYLDLADEFWRCVEIGPNGWRIAEDPPVRFRRWPAAPGQTFLRTLGIEIVFGREGRLGTRTIRITAMGENRTHDTVSTVSRVSDHGDRAGLNHPPPGLEQAL